MAIKKAAKTKKAAPLKKKSVVKKPLKKKVPIKAKVKKVESKIAGDNLNFSAQMVVIFSLVVLLLFGFFFVFLRSQDQYEKVKQAVIEDPTTYIYLRHQLEADRRAENCSNDPMVTIPDCQ